MNIRTRADSVGDDGKKFIVRLQQYQPQTENESYIYGEWQKTVTECNNLKIIVYELQAKVDRLMNRDNQGQSEMKLCLRKGNNSALAKKNCDGGWARHSDKKAERFPEYLANTFQPTTRF